MSNFSDVGDFHEKFGLDNVTHHGAGPRKPTDDLLDFRIKFMQEELDEFIEGRDEQNDAKMADALIDLAYVVFGTAQMLGYPWHHLWGEVQRANMTKERATKETASERGGEWDVIKPPGWKPPNIEKVLRDHGFDV